MIIPVVQKKSPPSPSISSNESYDTRPVANTNDVVTSAPRPQSGPTILNNFSRLENSVAKGSAQESSQVDKQVTVSSKNHSDTPELINRIGNTRPDLISVRQKHPELRSEILFYTPEGKPPESRHSSLPAKMNSPDIDGLINQNTLPIVNLPSPKIPDIVLERKVPEMLPLSSKEQDFTVEATSSPVEGKVPVRRTSSNDPGILRHSGTSRPERSSSVDLLSP